MRLPYLCQGGENSQKRVSLGGHALHPFLARSYTEVLKCFFEDSVLHRQKILASEDRFEKILKMIPDESVTSELRGRWLDSRRSSTNKGDISLVRWEQLKQSLQSGKHRAQGLRRCIEEIVFTFTYPRLDLGVSKLTNHLLKSPFCIHPKTGRVCVPIDPEHCEDFDPTTVPTLAQLMDELNEGGLGADGKSDLEKTSIGESMRYFRTSFLQPLLKACKDEMESSYNRKKLQQNKNSLNW
ncbi:hypothetical protein V2J09_003155 [Rumex salicifolius]